MSTEFNSMEKMTRDEIYKMCIQEPPIDGLFVEFGTARGESLSIFETFLRPGQKMYGFDSFQGLPEDWRGGYTKGHFACMPPAQFIDHPQIELVIGLFQDTLGPFLQEHHQNVSFIHIDCDLYSSTKYVLTELNERIVPGTLIHFDEVFNYDGWQDHEYKALLEFAKENDRTYQWVARDGPERATIRITK